jgi:hypothetical protein
MISKQIVVLYMKIYDYLFFTIGIHLIYYAWICPCEENLWWAKGFYEDAQLLINRRF